MEHWPASPATTPKQNVPAFDGVPVTKAPVTKPPVSVRPSGSVPEAMLSVYGGVPPLAAMGALYGSPLSPRGRTVVSMLTASSQTRTGRQNSRLMGVAQAGSVTVTVKQSFG